MTALYQNLHHTHKNVQSRPVIPTQTPNIRARRRRNGALSCFPGPWNSSPNKSSDCTNRRARLVVMIGLIYAGVAVYCVVVDLIDASVYKRKRWKTLVVYQYHCFSVCRPSAGIETPDRSYRTKHAFKTIKYIHMLQSCLRHPRKSLVQFIRSLNRVAVYKGPLECINKMAYADHPQGSMDCRRPTLKIRGETHVVATLRPIAFRLAALSVRSSAHSLIHRRLQQREMGLIALQTPGLRRLSCHLGSATRPFKTDDGAVS